MKITDIKALRKEVEREYINKGYSSEQLENALMNDDRYPKDRIIEVTGYDLENNKVLGLLGKKKCEVTISQAAFHKGEEVVAEFAAAGKVQSPTSWVGHKIDSNMEKSILAKSKLVLQESVIESKGEIISLVASRIGKIAPVNDKTFEGIFSPTTKILQNPKITKVQHWNAVSTGLSQTIENLRNDSVADTSNKPKNK